MATGLPAITLGDRDAQSIALFKGVIGDRIVVFWRRKGYTVGIKEYFSESLNKIWKTTIHFKISVHKGEIGDVYQLYLHARNRLFGYFNGSTNKATVVRSLLEGTAYGHHLENFDIAPLLNRKNRFHLFLLQCVITCIFWSRFRGCCDSGGSLSVD